jgi:hypothetical protein
MTEYQFHWWRSGTQATSMPSITLDAPSKLHGAALALGQFKQLGCDMGAPGAHVDVTDPDGARHTVLVEEVLDWIKLPEQTPFVERQGLATLLQ